MHSGVAPGQTVVAEPQWRGSVFKFTQAPITSVSPGRHMHCPVPETLKHAWSGWQTLPTMPQLSGSDVRSTQWKLPGRIGSASTVEPGGQVHAPDAHVPPRPQATLQPPQLLLSVVVLMHAIPIGPPQTVLPIGQTHAPATQLSPAMQRRPHVPQLFGSV
jgi:hypothetical protein